MDDNASQRAQDVDGSALGVSGRHTTDGIPHGSTSLTPFLVIERAGEAIDFYTEVFGARLVDATRIDGAVVHAELDLGNGKFQLGEPSPAFGTVPAPGGEGACYSLGLYCADVDGVFSRAVKYFAKIVRGRHLVLIARYHYGFAFQHSRQIIFQL